MKYVTDINKVDAKEYLSAKKISVDYVCAECGEKFGRKLKVSMTTKQLNECPLCGKTRGLIEVKFFNYLRK